MRVWVIAAVTSAVNRNNKEGSMIALRRIIRYSRLHRGNSDGTFNMVRVRHTQIRNSPPQISGLSPQPPLLLFPRCFHVPIAFMSGFGGQTGQGPRVCTYQDLFLLKPWTLVFVCREALIAVTNWLNKPCSQPWSRIMVSCETRIYSPPEASTLQRNPVEDVSGTGTPSQTRERW